ncbi:echinoderm microtubule-associated protein-like CG42247 [Scaptodrosophila lebanonensis]|uniref:Echinoderm microtubule-associated protein-like CG42247 n=1 Tax=Drosophila lebanonensis TaxID=7225 RepID=A0A6J2T7H4_DROLE|nr:echinoderm microtubule-associated protein-like CG42247 [Scaptodrosophila lebanonensis]
MSNEENDYMGAPAAATATADDDADDAGGGNDAANANNESVLGGQTMPQISSNAQLEGNVSPTPTQFDDNQINNNSINNNNDNESSRSSPVKRPTSRGHSSNRNSRNINGNPSSFQIQPQHDSYANDDDDEDELTAGDLHADNVSSGAAVARGGAGGHVPDYWQQRNGASGIAVGSGAGPGPGGATGPGQSGRHSRALSPSYLDNMSENSEQPPIVPLVRSKSRPEISSAAAARYNNLSYWKARRVVFYRNGDPFFPGVELRYRPGRDVTSLDNLLDKISPKMDLPRGARYVFSMDGDRKYHLDELEDGAFYVVSSFKAFKVSPTSITSPPLLCIAFG